MACHGTICDQVIKRFGHCFHHSDASLQLPFFPNRNLAHITAARRSLMPKSQELCNLDKREAAILGLLDEADAPHRIAIVEPIPGYSVTSPCGLGGSRPSTRRAVIHSAASAAAS